MEFIKVGCEFYNKRCKLCKISFDENKGMKNNVSIRWFCKMYQSSLWFLKQHVASFVKISFDINNEPLTKLSSVVGLKSEWKDLKDFKFVNYGDW